MNVHDLNKIKSLPTNPLTKLMLLQLRFCAWLLATGLLFSTVVAQTPVPIKPERGIATLRERSDFLITLSF